MLRLAPVAVAAAVVAEEAAAVAADAEARPDCRST
jgi:hypothetical protein